jgi:hypothetical protein
MPIMRSFALVFLAAALASAADVKDFSKIAPLDARGRFTLDTYKGSIRISAWDQPRAEIHAHIVADPGWRAMPVEDVEILVDSSAGDVRVKTEYRHHFNEGNLPRVEYTIRVPRGANLRIKDYKSDSDISGVQGEVEFETYKGTARLDGGAGVFDLSTYKGEIRGNFSRFAGPSRINTYKGTIDISLPRASAFELRSRLSRRAGLACDFPRTIHSTHHERSLDGAVNGGGAPLDVRSYRGNIRLRSL